MSTHGLKFVVLLGFLRRGSLNRAIAHTHWTERIFLIAFGAVPLA
jgi:hypothetical protein